MTLRLYLCYSFILINSLLINSLQFLAFALNQLARWISKLGGQARYHDGWYRRFIDTTQDAFLELLYLTLCLFAPGTRLNISWPDAEQDPWHWLTGNDRGMLISNHITYVDWMYIWLMFRQIQPSKPESSASGLKIILKSQLKQVPIIGWGMQFFDFLFLDRKWESDQLYLSQRLSKLSDIQQVWILLFPEGTVLTPNTRSQMVKYAQKSRIPVNDLPKHVLLPRSTGLAHCLETFKSLDLLNLNPSPSIKWLMDITIGYSELGVDSVGDETLTFSRIFGSGKGTDVHLNLCRRFIDYDNLDLKDDPAPDGNLIPFSRWLNGIWKEKDLLMKGFYANKKFPTRHSKVIEISWQHLDMHCLALMYEFWVVLIMLIWILSQWPF